METTLWDDVLHADISVSCEGFPATHLVRDGQALFVLVLRRILEARA